MSETEKKSNAKGMLNTEGIGKIIAVIKETDGKKEKKKHHPSQEVYVCDNKEGASLRHPETEIHLQDGYKFQVAINRQTERQIGYVCGQSGAGKSWFCKKFMEEYHSTYPSRAVYIVSSLADDPTLDVLKYIKRIKLTEEFIADPIKCEDIEDSLILFDDTDCISAKKLRDAVNALRDSVLQTGRHFKISCLITSHSCCNGNWTKLILSECHFVTIFLQGLGGRSVKYLLENYLGLDKNQIKKIKQIESRAITILKTYPTTVVAEQVCYLLKNDEDGK